jgi:multidrug efflux pump subunit AcrA (membrane-fusion protein)
MQPPKKIDLLLERSDEVQEILRTPPRWPIMWGNTVIFFTMLVLLLLCWIIKYPDELQADIVLTTATPPNAVVAKSSGKISLIVNENELVKKNGIVCVLDNSARYLDVLSLSTKLDSLGNHLGTIDASHFSPQLQVGEIQGEYNDFIAAVNRNSFFETNIPIEREIASIRNQISKNMQLLKQQEKQRAIYQKQLQLVQVDYDRDKKLFEQQVISAKSFEEKEQVLLTASANFETAESNVASTQIKLAELEKDLQRATIQNSRETNDLTLSVQESYQKLKSAIATWEQKYVLRSPIDGTASFFNYWSKNQFVKVGDEVMTIVPEGSQVVIGKVRMPVQNSGKAKIGQRVNIQLENYPYEEYGMVLGRVKNISLVPRENLYAIDVELPAKLMTTYNKELEFRHELQGHAEIITEDLRLLERMFYQIRKIFVN